jgi:hypothetical protein
MNELSSDNPQICTWGSDPIYDGDEPCGKPAKYDAGGGLYLCEAHLAEAIRVWGEDHGEEDGSPIEDPHLEIEEKKMILEKLQDLKRIMKR